MGSELFRKSWKIEDIGEESIFIKFATPPRYRNPSPQPFISKKWRGKGYWRRMVGFGPDGRPLARRASGQDACVTGRILVHLGEGLEDSWLDFEAVFHAVFEGLRPKGCVVLAWDLL